MAGIEQQIHTLIAQGQWADLLHDCEAFELEASAKNSGFGSSFFFSSYLLAYLISNDTANARFLYKRLAPQAKQDPTVQAVWAVGKCLWNRQTAAAHAAIAGYSWPAEHHATVQALAESIRDRTLQLFASAYSNIAVGEFSAALGCDSNEAITRGKAKGIVDKIEGDFVFFKEVAHEQEKPGVSTGLQTLKKLASHSLFIESV